MGTAVVWFRRDLRLHDHPALWRAAEEFARVVPLFVLDPALLSGRYRSDARVAFMHACLAELDAALGERGAGLVVREGRPEREVARVAREAGADAVLWTSDVSPYARSRDRRVTAALERDGVRALPHGGNYVVDVSRPRTKDGRPFSVFTPFMRAWEHAERRPVLTAPARLRGALEPTGVPDGPAAPFALPPAGEAAARRRAGAWLAGGACAHDRLAGGTSELSPYLRWGCLSACELESRTSGEFRRRLCWRDFFAHVLLHFPANLDHAFQERMRGLEWDHDDELLAAWRDGRTGFPLVDAGMRQLAATGWMHNRARLVVGSFLVKDLHQDWRTGEEHFARLLLDGEPAQNNGNWQWIASTGVDPQPPFKRMINPARQQQRFDPDGDYVRRWVPELRDVDGAELHDPSPATREACGYPEPVVDHQIERRRALERYNQARAR